MATTDLFVVPVGTVTHRVVMKSHKGVLLNTPVVGGSIMVVRGCDHTPLTYPVSWKGDR